MPNETKHPSDIEEIYVAEIAFKEIYVKKEAYKLVDGRDGLVNFSRAFVPFEILDVLQDASKEGDEAGPSEEDVQKLLSDEDEIEGRIKKNWKKKPEEEQALYRFFRAEFDSEKALKLFLASVEGDERLVQAIEEPKMELFASGLPQSNASQWALNQINAINAWPCSQGDEVLISVVDTGIDATHLDLLPNLWYHQSGAITLHGVNFAVPWPIPFNLNIQDIDDHGTHVAGIAAGRGQNSLGIAGVAPKARILAMRSFIDHQTPSPASWTYNGIVYSRIFGADVINCSWGNPVPQTWASYVGTANYAAITYATSPASYPSTRPSILVFAAGNDNVDASNLYPQSDPRVITVGATDNSDNKANFSNFGSSLDVSAPGVSINSTLSRYAGNPTNSYGSSNGTSMAAPIISGVVALILEKHPNMDFNTVKRILQTYVQPVNSNVPMGAGRIDLEKISEVLCGCGCGPCTLDRILLERQLTSQAGLKFNVVPSQNSPANTRPGEMCEPQQVRQLTPHFYLHWGDSPQDQLETDDREVLYITACNPYENIGFSGLRILKIEITPNQVTPNGEMSVELAPSELICYDELEPCTCATREYGLFNRQASVGTHNFRFYYCVEDISVLNQNRGEDVFVLDYVNS